ncbi:hypothetical protein [Microbulbifer rhizosphaerae]|uniref:PepSY-associated TM region n=1 Tax=Microbulbifer rhizosphaerae TaxID=1562603 RepID=A0A7W4ZAX9_9GAMM|nr:hypothetical protein [Microbulbifer rhizosphaerae]MBB3063268.1 hypothetical protein [Microbulbifer rhizosphaerae]
MKVASLARKIHKWIFLFIGIQALLWVMSGFYMVVVNLDFIHGDHLVKNQNEPISILPAQLYPTEKLLQRFGTVESIALKSIQQRPHYVVHEANGAHLVDAISGTEIPPVDRATAISLAEYYFSGNQPAASAQLIEENPPSEIQSRPLPLWRIDFDDRFGTSFYIDPQTAQLVTRRHDYWRAFDFFWMLHIMDYEAREDVNNWLLRSVTLFSLTSVLAGFLLLFYSFGRRAGQKI